MAGAVDGKVCLLEFADRRMLETQLQRIQRHFQTVFAPGTDPVLEQLDEQLQSYFAGQRADFDLPLDLTGTDFQSAVWQRLQQIPTAKRSATNVWPARSAARERSAPWAAPTATTGWPSSSPATA